MMVLHVLCRHAIVAKSLETGNRWISVDTQDQVLMGLNPPCGQSVYNYLPRHTSVPELGYVLKEGEKSQFLFMKEVIVRCYDHM